MSDLTLPEYEEIVEARDILNRILYGIEEGLLGYIGPELEPVLQVVEKDGLVNEVAPDQDPNHPNYMGELPI